MGIDIILIILLIGIDQLVKYLTVINLKGNDPIILIENVFQLTYVENKGAAFGIMQNQRLFFVVITLILLIAITYFYFKMPKVKRFYMLRFATILFISGAIGNLIDRIRLSYVIDTFYFSLINFPVFNVADSYVVIAAILYLYLLLFYYKEEELEFLKLRRNKDERN